MYKSLLPFFLSFALFQGAVAQDANVSVSNLSNNVYYTGFDANTQVISGINFEVLSDGDDSNKIISDFEVSLYLIGCDANGNITGSNPVVIKTYSVSGFQQLHSIDYVDETVDLKQVSNIADGTYRLGVWVNSNDGVPNPPDDPSDNAFAMTLNGNGNKPQSVITVSSTAAVTNSISDLGIVISTPVSKDMLQTILANNSKYSVSIFDFTGRSQDLNNLNAGMYILKLEDENNRSYTKKIIVE